MHSKKFTELGALVAFYKSNSILALQLTNPCGDKGMYVDLYKLPNFSELQIWKLDWKELRLGEEIGNGNFGTVNRGKWYGGQLYSMKSKNVF